MRIFRNGIPRLRMVRSADTRPHGGNALVVDQPPAEMVHDLDLRTGDSDLVVRVCDAREQVKPQWHGPLSSVFCEPSTTPHPWMRRVLSAAGAAALVKCSKNSTNLNLQNTSPAIDVADTAPVVCGGLINSDTSAE
jgi:hypothetical protein